MIYFISGHRDITQKEFDTHYKPVIDNVIKHDDKKTFLIGDYEGVDIMAQKYLVSKGLTDCITVYHMFKSPRNIACSEITTCGGYKSDEERDAAMTNDSDFDIAFVRKGKETSGTAQNLMRRHLFV